MRFTMKPGAAFETSTPAEVAEIIATAMSRRREEEKLHIRAGATILLDDNGAGQSEVYTVPAGMLFAARRVFVNISSATAPGTGNVALDAADVYVAYLRSGILIEYADPHSAVGTASVPGAQSWGEEQGPILLNSETFEVAAVLGGDSAGLTLDCMIEGLLSVRGQQPARMPSVRR